ncbi:protransforming growth factor alpha-like isoform X2 [Pelobates fuscus]|uniref:protransforming growth factor alpha-like isoform X2 n=1 Tax=Pelobates fuscus TaxID=191477 RepID=UPI002FE45449
MYTCMMFSQLVLVLAASLTVKAPPQMFADCPEKFRDYCTHGTCRFLVSEWEASCICLTGYFGSRCQYLDFLQVMTVDPRTFTMVALAVSFLVLLTVTGSACISIYVCRRRSNRMALLNSMDSQVNLTRYANRKPCISYIEPTDLEEVCVTEGT